MEPFFFDAGNTRLLGLYHPPTGAGPNTGVLICPPILGEYMRTHGCLRQLAINLAAKGYHVLRFDYSGTGDSSGTIHDAAVDLWCQEIAQASQELRDISGVSNINIIGVRLGAALAVLASRECNGLQRLLLWDPVLSGSDYLAQLVQTYQDLIDSHESLPPAESNKAKAGITGYGLGQSLVKDIESIQLNNMEPNDAQTSVLITNKDLYDSGTWQKSYDDCRFVNCDCQWETFSESVIFGQPMVATLTDIL